MLENLAPHIPFVGTLLEYLTTAKLKATFVDKLTGGVVRPGFRVLTRSGRTSSFGEINGQNLPRAAGVRECFVPRPGSVLIAADYATIELATLAQACTAQFGWKSEMAAVINAGTDLHRLIAGRVLGKDPDTVTDDERSKAQPINLGKPDGMGARTLRGYAKQTYRVNLSDEEVAGLSAAWFETFPEMTDFLADESEATNRRLADLLGLTPADHAAKTGDGRFLWRAERDGTARRPSPILVAMLLKAVAAPDPVSRDGRPYPEADVDYFWTKVQSIADLLPADVRNAVARREPSYRVKKALRALGDRARVYTLTGRLRANTGFCQRHNTVFQGLAAHGAKLGLWKLWRAGFRLVNFIHDEVLIEVPAAGDLAATAERIRKLMVAGMKAVVPDVAVTVEYAAMRRWYKKAKAVYDAKGLLVRWEPAAPKTIPASAAGNGEPARTGSTAEVRDSSPAV